MTEKQKTTENTSHRQCLNVNPETLAETEGLQETTISLPSTLPEMNTHQPSAITSQGEEARAGPASTPEAKAGSQNSSRVEAETLPWFAGKNTKKLDKSAKKALKKLAHMMRLVTAQLGTVQSSLPTQWVAIWGAGLDLNTPKSLIMDFFDPSPVEIRLYHNRAYCSAKWDSPSDAMSALDGVNGKELIPAQPVYMAFLGTEPPEEDRRALRPFHKQWPTGLTIMEDFISETEEKELLIALFPDESERPGTNKQDVFTDNLNAKLNKAGCLRNRSVKHFGYQFRYGSNDVDFENPMNQKIPDFMDPIITRMMTRKIIFRKPEQMTMNHYLPGQGIPAHVDTHSVFEAPILSLSLHDSVVMNFRERNNEVSVHVPRRSLVIMDKEARLLWTHGIAGRSHDIIEDAAYGGLTVRSREERVSLTFRLLDHRRICQCSFPHMCDSQKAQVVAEKTAAKLEQDLVHRVYENIAPHFSATRHTPWPKVREFVVSLFPGQTMLDLGCGNGKYFNLVREVYQVGADMSMGLLEIAHNKSVDGVRANCLKLPFRDGSFNAAICIAVLHHISTKDRRLDALRELLRVLSTQGMALIYVWSKKQQQKEVKSNYALHQAQKAGRDEDKNQSAYKFSLDNYSFLPIHDNAEDFASNDVLVPWRSGDLSNTVEHRFYHVFEQGELEGLLLELDPPPRILESYYDQGNWCVRLQKSDPEPSQTHHG